MNYVVASAFGKLLQAVEAVIRPWFLLLKENIQIKFRQLSRNNSNKTVWLMTGVEICKISPTNVFYDFQNNILY